MLIVVNQCKLRCNSNIQYLISSVFDCAAVVNFRSEIDVIFTTICTQPLYVFILFLQVK